MSKNTTDAYQHHVVETIKKVPEVKKQVALPEEKQKQFLRLCDLQQNDHFMYNIAIRILRGEHWLV